ncbi:MAG: hypothetical protein RMA76_31030 [Deltaproteobacteria bacterium]|jgi:hypothetical protein
MKRPDALAWIVLFCGLSTACTYEVQIVGRLAFPDDTGCVSPVWSQSVGWKECHAFKRRFSAATGALVTTDTATVGSLRPLPGRLSLTYYEILPTSKRRCGGGTFVVDRDGVFDIRLPRSCGRDKRVLVEGRVALEAPAWHPSARSPIEPGWIRAAWTSTHAADLLGSEPEHRLVPAFEHDGVPYATPTFVFRWVGLEPVKDAQGRAFLNVGTQVFTAGSAHDRFGYMRQVLNGYTNVVALFDRLEANTRDMPDLFEKMLPKSELYRGQPTYLIAFNTQWASAGGGWMSLFRPDKAVFSTRGIGPALRHLSDTDTLAHEFGHSIHGSLAPGSRLYHYEFGNAMMRADGTSYDWGHYAGQYAELGVEYTEGVANGLGQYLLNACSDWRGWAARPLGGAVPFRGNLWSADASCDASDGCGFHHVRFHLRKRGVTEDSRATSDWTKRVGRLAALTATADRWGQGVVTSNDEFRWGELTCDLLDANADIAHARITDNATYLSNFVEHVGEIFDGNDPTATSERFGVVGAEDVQITLTDLIGTMRDFCAACSTLPGPYGADYNRLRLSATKSPIGPHAFLKKLVADGKMTRAQASNLLQSNLMEHKL